MTLTGWIDDFVKTREQFDRVPKRGFIDLSRDPLPPQNEQLQPVDNEDDDYEPTELAEDQEQTEQQSPWQGPLPVVSRRRR